MATPTPDGISIGIPLTHDQRNAMRQAGWPEPAVAKMLVWISCSEKNPGRAMIGPNRNDFHTWADKVESFTVVAGRKAAAAAQARKLLLANLGVTDQ